MQQVVGTGHVQQSAIDGHVGGDRRGPSVEWNCGGHRLGVEAVNQDTEVGGNDVNLSGIGREEEVDGVESALPDIDVDWFKGYVLWGVGDGDGLRTKRAKRCVGRSLGGIGDVYKRQGRSGLLGCTFLIRCR